MSDAFSAPMPAPSQGWSRGAPWLWVMVGLAALYVPTYWRATGGVWQSDDHSHGPIVLAVTIWLFWSLRDRIADLPERSSPALGWAVFLFGLCVYCLGRLLSVTMLEFASQPLVVAGALLLLKGVGAIRLAWFAVFFLIFMIPLPSVLVDAITGPLKNLIANLVEGMLYRLGYPIARSGVILSIGQYQLQVADACSGLHSMFSLSALGTLFMYVTGRKNKLHLTVMLASILPIAFLANIIRVIALVLITYYLGDEAGQGFLHGAAGIVLMMVALAALFLLDALLARLLPDTGRVASTAVPSAGV